MTESVVLSSSVWSRRACLAACLAVPALSAWAADVPQEAADRTLDIWQRSRAQWLVNPRVAYFDNATVVPMNRAVLAAQYRALENFNADPAGFYASRLSAAAVRQLLAPLSEWLSCGVDELCLVRSDGLALLRVLTLLRWQAGDEVVVAAQLPQPLLEALRQFAATQGVALVTVHLPMPIANAQQVIDAFSQAMSARTRAVCVSHVQAGDGAVLPVELLCALARERGIVTVVEGMLATGAMPLSLSGLGCDVYLGSLSHALHGPAPLACLYVSSALQATLGNQAQAMNLPASVEIADWPVLQRRWPEELVYFAPQAQALATALQWHQGLGSVAVMNRLRRLQTYARLQLQALAGAHIVTPNDYGLQLHVLSLNCEARSSRQIAAWLQRNDTVVVRALSGESGTNDLVQLTFDVCNSLDDIDRLVLGLQRALKI